MAIVPTTACVLASRDLTIGPATPSDAPYLRAMLLATAEDSPGMVTTAHEMAERTEALPSLIAAYAANPDRVWLVAREGEQVVGELSCRCGSPARLAHVARLGMSVAKPCRGIGVGNALLTRAVDWAETHPGVLRITLAVVADNAAAIALYQRHGFVTEGTRVRQIQRSPGEFIDDLFMARTMKSKA